MELVGKKVDQPLGAMVPLVAMVEEPLMVGTEVLLLEEEVEVKLVGVDPEVPLPVKEEIQGIRMIQIRIQS